MSHRILNKTAALTFLAFVFAPHAPAQCTSRAVTNIVHVTFSACKPADTLTVLIGGEPVLLTRIDKQTTWRGETENTFTLNERTLEVDDADIPSIRFSCSTTAKPRDAGDCVAHYHVSCEDLWYVEVRKVPENSKATISYALNPPKPTVQPCVAVTPPVSGQREIELARSESLLVQVDKPRLDIPLNLRCFKRRKELSLLDVVPSAYSELAAVRTNPAMQALKKSLLLDSVTDLLFTKKD
jgi:hypothetical protein